MLGKAGYEVVGATGCESAAEALDKHQFDLVLLDVSLSEAWELRRQITGSENSPQVLMMGTMPAYFYDEMPEDFDRSKYLQKLLPREKLLGIVEMAVRRAGEAGGGRFEGAVRVWLA